MPFPGPGGEAGVRAIGGNHSRRARFVIVAIIIGVVLGASSMLSWYVEAL
jgi:hypothetical protein